MHLRLKCRIADQYIPGEYESFPQLEKRVLDECNGIIDEAFERIGLKDFIVSTYREESPFISKRGKGDEPTVTMYWQEIVVSLHVTYTVVYSKAKLKFPELVPALTGKDFLYLGRNSSRIELRAWR